jgi:hypothetical protein
MPAPTINTQKPDQVSDSTTPGRTLQRSVKALDVCPPSRSTRSASSTTFWWSAKVTLTSSPPVGARDQLAYLAAIAANSDPENDAPAQDAPATGGFAKCRTRSR